MLKLLIAAFLVVADAFTVGPAVATARSTVSVTMVDQFRWSTAKAGGKVSLSDAPSDIKWAKAAWESLGKDGKASVTEECYMISDQAPDASKEWFFCSSPSEDPNMTCEAMPSYMGKMADGKTVYICSTPKVA